MIGRQMAINLLDRGRHVSRSLHIMGSPNSPYGWKKEEAGKHLNQPALSRTVTFEELEAKASKDPRVLRWKADIEPRFEAGKWEV